MRRRMRRIRSGKSVTGKRRSSTPVRGHYRRKPTGGKTYVRPHRRQVMKNEYQNFRYVITTPFSLKQQMVEKTCNTVLTGLSIMFPQYSPIIELGRVAFNNREKLVPFFKTMFSNKTDREKVELITDEIGKGVKNELVKEFSRRASTELSGIIDRRIGFTKMLQTLNKGFTKSDANVVRGFFDSTLERLILDSSMSVM